MSISCQGFNNQILTFKKGKNLNQRVLVTMNNDGEAVNAESTFIGVVDSIRGDVVGVQMEGYVEFPYSGSGFTTGNVALKPANSGTTVTGDTTGHHYYRVLTVNNRDQIIGFIL